MLTWKKYPDCEPINDTMLLITNGENVSLGYYTGNQWLTMQDTDFNDVTHFADFKLPN